MKRTTTLTLLTASAFLLTAWGCSDTPSVSSSDKEVSVKGKVTYKGKELLKAKVQFETANINRPNAPTFTFDVQDDGTYSGKTLIGENNITVSPPPNWKSKTEFPMNRKVEVLTDGENVVDIDLTESGTP